MKKFLKFAAAGCLGLPLLALLGIAGLAKGCDFLDSRATVWEVRDQLREIKRGEMEKAYKRMAGSWRAMNDPEDFVAFVNKHPALKDNRDSTFWHWTTSIDVGTVVLEDAVLTSNSGVREVFRIERAQGGGLLIIPAEDKK